MSVYKEPIAWLRQSIDSILYQTFSDFEFIIICDNPQYDDAIALLKKYAYKDSRIKILFNETNIGLTKSLNKGLAIAQGKYIARMDADDISYNNRFEKQYAFLEDHPNIILLGTNIKYFGECPFYYRFLKQSSHNDNDIKATLLYTNCIAHPSVFIRRSVLETNLLKYDENYRANQDYRMWETLYDRGEFAILKEKLLLYRISSQQITKTKNIEQRYQSQTIKMRLQKKWLEKNGLKYTNTELEEFPYDILCKLKRIKKICTQKEYYMFLQYVYIESCDRGKFLKALFSGDFFYFSFQEKLIYLRNCIKRYI